MGRGPGQELVAAELRGGHRRGVKGRPRGVRIAPPPHTEDPNVAVPEHRLLRRRIGGLRTGLSGAGTIVGDVPLTDPVIESAGGAKDIHTPISL